MQGCSRCCYILIALSMLLGFIVFILLSNAIIVVTNPMLLFILFIAVGTISLLSFFLNAVIADRLGNLNFLYAYSGCGNLTVFSGIILIILSFVLLLATTTASIVFFIGVTICFFLLSLLLGGIGCFIRAYIRRNC